MTPRYTIRPKGITQAVKYRGIAEYMELERIQPLRPSTHTRTHSNMSIQGIGHQYTTQATTQASQI